MEKIEEVEEDVDEPIVIVTEHQGHKNKIKAQ